MNNSKILNNKVEMPRLIHGLPLIMGIEGGITQEKFTNVLRTATECGIWGFDTSHDYGKSEAYIGNGLKKLFASGITSREKVFIVSKIGNGQQYEGDIERCVDMSLKTMHLDYLDCMLLHWPVPNHFVENWSKLHEIYKKGKIRAIGIANAKVRHIKEMESIAIPQVVQTEIHPFNTCQEIRKYAQEKGIALQACSALCMMATMVKENPVLNEVAKKYGKSVAQIMLRWSLQSDIAPIYRAFNEKHIVEMKELFSFELSDEDMTKVSNLNIDYRYHPESSNCAGF